MDYISLHSLAVLRQSAAHFLPSSPVHLSHSVAHFSHILAHSAHTLLTSLASAVIAFFVFSQAAIHSLQAFVQALSFVHAFSQLLHEAMQASHAAIHSLNLSLLNALFTVPFSVADGIFAAIVINPIAANNKINFFMVFVLKVIIIVWANVCFFRSCKYDNCHYNDCY